MNYITPRMKFFLKILFGGFIVAFLIWSFDVNQVISQLASFPLLLIIPVAVIYLFTLFILSMRWRFILHAMHFDLPPWTALEAFTAGVLLSDISPGRVGEVSRPYFIKELVPVGTGLASFLLDRFVDIMGKIFLFMIALVFFSYMLPSEHSFLVLLLLLFPFIILSVLFFTKEKNNRFKFLLKYNRLHEFVSDFQSGIRKVDHPIWVLMITSMWTVFAAVLQGFRLVILAWGIGYYLPLMEITILQSLMSALSLVPVSIAGLGLVEGGLTVVLSSFGIPAASGLTLAVLDRVITVCVHVLVGLKIIIRRDRDLNL